ncbi:hypothetical protein BGX27_006880, partial [Mortierella sp. AM989]
NIYSLGPVTNYSIIKSLIAQDAESVVSAYLSHITVSTKNTTGETFDMSLRVFVHKKQTLIIPQDATEPSLSFNDLRNRFRDLCSQYEQIKKNRLPEERSANGQIIRLRSPQTPNRFKTVESP